MEYLTDLSMDQLLYRMAHTPRDTIVLPISYTRDSSGNTHYSTRDVVRSLSLVCPAPMYVAADTTIGSGTRGGYVVDFDKTGSVIAEIAIQTLKGNPAAQLSVPADATASYIFDWRQRQKWGISERNLPRGSVVRFKTISAWERYR